MTAEIIKKAKYYQDVQLWPRKDKLNYTGWLSNFSDNEDKELAKLILDFLVYYPEDIVEQLIYTVVGKCGYKLKELNGNWTKNDFKTNCWYSYIPGEHPHETDSGKLFLRKVRDVINVNESREMSFEQLLMFLESETTPQNVILVDDFVGSGSQCCTAWNYLQLKDGNTLATINVRTPHRIFYAPLVMNKDGYRRIISYCKDLNLETIHVLGDEYNLFNRNCLCWKGDEDLYNRGTEMIIRKSNEIGLTLTEPRCSLCQKGLQNQGLALAFNHGMPDACPPFFYWDQNGWTPLITKHYPR